MACCAALLEGQELLGAEGLVVDLARGLNEILQMGAGEEVAEVDELAMGLILDVDDAPSVGTTTDSSAINGDVLLASDHGKGHD